MTLVALTRNILRHGNGPVSRGPGSISVNGPAAATSLP